MPLRRSENEPIVPSTHCASAKPRKRSPESVYRTTQILGTKKNAQNSSTWTFHQIGPDSVPSRGSTTHSFSLTLSCPLFVVANSTSLTLARLYAPEPMGTLTSHFSIIYSSPASRPLVIDSIGEQRKLAKKLIVTGKSWATAPRSSMSPPRGRPKVCVLAIF